MVPVLLAATPSPAARWPATSEETLTASVPDSVSPGLMLASASPDAWPALSSAGSVPLPCACGAIARAATSDAASAGLARAFAAVPSPAARFSRGAGVVCNCARVAST
eukprot:351140-Chlamydomonas_euryale.AAC.9